MINQSELINVLQARSKEFPELSSINECESLANSLLDIVLASKSIEALLSSRERLSSDDAVHLLRSEIRHICYHILDSELLREILRGEVLTSEPVFPLTKI